MSGIVVGKYLACIVERSLEGLPGPSGVVLGLQGSCLINGLLQLGLVHSRYGRLFGKGCAGIVEGLEGIVDLLLGGIVVRERVAGGVKRGLEISPGIGGVVVGTQAGGIVDRLLELSLVDDGCS